MENFVPIGSLIVTLAAVIAGPWLANRQIAKAAVSSARRKWINEIRDSAAEFLAYTQMVASLNANKFSDQDSIPRIQNVLQLIWKLELLLNPAEDEHKVVMKLANTLGGSMNVQEQNGVEIDSDSIQGQLVSALQVIIKKEWERVKKSR